MSAARLAFDDVGCLRGGRMLFDGLSFVLGPGDAAVVTGPNGIGKSSLLRLAAGLLVPAHGTIERSGGTALADEALALDMRLPLGRALRFWAGLDGNDPTAAMAALGIAHLAPVPVRMLSTGQRKRATLARMVASGAAVWLLDEPGNALDAQGLGALATILADHRARGGIVLAATHQPIGIADAKSIALEGHRR